MTPAPCLAKRFFLLTGNARTAAVTGACGEVTQSLFVDVDSLSTVQHFPSTVSLCGAASSDSALLDSVGSSQSARDASSTSGSDKLHSSTQPSESSFNDAEATSSKLDASIPCQHRQKTNNTTSVMERPQLDISFTGLLLVIV